MSDAALRQCLSFQRAYAAFRARLDDDLGTWHGIDFDDFVMLHALAGAGHEPGDMRSLATQLGTSRSALLRRVRALEKVGLVDYHGGVADRRVTLRPAGRRLVATARETVEDAWARHQPMPDPGKHG
ncbi:DNA-binding MarR family transcriptional regulator [Pseudoduganella lurida]|uniref:DNA-binding MarR family transcriptional regulator n=1 Tax=Pseudoduganella lurida TaxID=1036180 RepID=A0A562RN69_9BURK|nr:MarR family transcriptional regulator [Pseudoduganella lurida]TWI70024.1 DNA-binding MarR family transcriptional regulator [Pseudoduganella lurida]